MPNLFKLEINLRDWKRQNVCFLFNISWNTCILFLYLYRPSLKDI